MTIDFKALRELDNASLLTRFEILCKRAGVNHYKAEIDYELLSELGVLQYELIQRLERKNLQEPLRFVPSVVKRFTVNGQRNEWTDEYVSHSQLVELATGITESKRTAKYDVMCIVPEKDPDGILVWSSHVINPDESIRAIDNMRVRVTEE